jgi:hypothetical protein
MPLEPAFPSIVSSQTVPPLTHDSIRPAALVILAGSVRQTELARTASRPLVDLPLRPDYTLASAWREAAEELRSDLSTPALPLLVTANSIAGQPKSFAADSTTTIRMDSNEPRGSGGALRDALLGFAPESHVLIAPGHALPRGKLSDVLKLLSSPRADIVIHADAAGAPTGFLLLRCGVLASVSHNGFADLKEQVLPQLAKKFDVRVIRGGLSTPASIRSLAGYIHALRAAASPSPLPRNAEDWRSTFVITEAGAQVHETARLHDSVVLAGGRVGAGAVVVRCLVGPSGVVDAGESVFDRLIGSENE